MPENDSVNPSTNQNPDPAVVNTPVPAPAAVTKPKQGSGNGKRRDIIEIPATAFKTRVKQEARGQAAQLLKEQLGMSLDDAKALIARAQAGAPGSTSTNPQAIANEAVEKLRRENEKLRRESAQHKAAADMAEKKREKETRRLKDRQIESELRYTFKDAGCNDPDYALHLFQRQALTDAAIEPGAFVEGLRKSRPMLFGNGAPAEPTRVLASTAPPASQNPGESRTPPAPAGSSTAPKAKSVDDMTPSEFDAYRKARYGASLT